MYQYVKQLVFLIFSTANYLNSWKCIEVLKGDGSAKSAKNVEKAEVAASQSGSASIRYNKLPPITHPSQVVWH